MSTRVDDFLKRYWSPAVDAGRRTGLSPALILGQAALETGWGQHVANNNMFGIKGKGAVQTTQEMVNGRMVTIRDSFRVYSSPEQSFAGWADFINGNKRYAGVKQGKTTAEQIALLAKAGYASDENYASKLYGIMGTINRSGAKIGNEPVGSILRDILPQDLQDFLGGTVANGLMAPADAVSGAVAAVTPDWNTWFQRGALLVFSLIFIAAALFAFKGGDAITIVSKAGKVLK